MDQKNPGNLGHSTIFGVESAKLTKPLKYGRVILVRYHDHLLFRDVDPAQFPRTWIREAIGWLDYEDDECVRLVWERFTVPDSAQGEPRAVGVTIYKKAVVEMKRFG